LVWLILARGSSSNSWSEKSEARSISSSEFGGLLRRGGAEGRVGPCSTSFSSSSLTPSGGGRSVRDQMGVEPRRPAYNLN